MKNALRILTLIALAATFALPAIAQDAAQQQPAAQVDEAAKAALYEKWLNNRAGTPEQQRTAYEAGKEYVAKYGNPPDAYSQAVQKWLPKYEKAVRDFEFGKALEAKDMTRALQLGRDIMAAESESQHVNITLAQSIVLSNNKALFPEGVRFARAALTGIEQGRITDKFGPFANRDEAVSGLNYILGFLLLDTSPDEAATHLMKVAQSNTKFKSDATTYDWLGIAYFKGEFNRLAADYKTNCEGKDATPECDAKFARVNQVLDRVIDAYARAAFYSKDAAQKKQITDRLTPLYKSRHENATDANVQEFIAASATRPIPVPGQEPAPTATPASTTTPGTTAPASGNSTGNGTGTASTQPATTTPSTGAKPKP